MGLLNGLSRCPTGFDMTAPFCRWKTECEMLKDELDFRSSLLIQWKQSLYWTQANVTPESASLPCSVNALIKAVCSWIVCTEVLLMSMYTVACACVCTCLWKVGVHIRCLLHCFPSCFLADAVDWLTSKPQGSSFCASPTQTTAVQSHQLLGSGRLNSDPHVCTSYTL